MKKGPRPVYYLTDGTPLVDAIKARGLNAVTVYSRIRRGLSPDEAVAVTARPGGRPSVHRLKDGRALSDAIRQADVDRASVYRAVGAGLSPDDAFSRVQAHEERARLRRQYFRDLRAGLSPVAPAWLQAEQARKALSPYGRYVTPSGLPD